MIRHLSRLPETSAALALLFLYLAGASVHSYSIDGVLMYRQAVSISEHLSLQFAQPLHWGGLYWTSKYGIGLSLLYVPGVKLLSLFGLLPPVPQVTAYDGNLFYHDAVYAIAGAPVHLIVTVATAWLVAQLVRDLGFGTRPALFALAAFGVASPAVVYARGDFAQPLLGLCATASLVAAFRYRRSPGAGSLTVAAAGLCLAVLTRPVEGSFLFPAVLGAAAPGFHAHRWTGAYHRMIAAAGFAYVLAVAVTLLVNWGRFGSPFQTGYSQISWGTPIWTGVSGVLVSPARGILWQFPLIVLAPLGLRLLWATPHRAFAMVISTFCVAILLNTALWVPWWGAWSWGSRLFVPALPLTAALASIGATSLGARWRAWLPAILFAGGVVWAVPGSVTDLLWGYAGAYDGSSQSFELTGYPPIGAWRFVGHHTLDIVWLRIAHQTKYLSLAAPLILGACAVALGRRSLVTERAEMQLAPELR